MNRNDKAAQKFLEARDKERKAVAGRIGKKPEDCTFRSYPMDRRVRFK